MHAIHTILPFFQDLFDDFNCSCLPGYTGAVCGTAPNIDTTTNIDTTATELVTSPTAGIPYHVGTWQSRALLGKH